MLQSDIIEELNDSIFHHPRPFYSLMMTSCVSDLTLDSRSLFKEVAQLYTAAVLMEFVKMSVYHLRRTIIIFATVNPGLVQISKNTINLIKRNYVCTSSRLSQNFSEVSRSQDQGCQF